MYLKYFGLSQHPFVNTPDTTLFYPGADRGPILDGVLYALVNGDGVTKVVGEAGSGKTTLCRMVKNRLPGPWDLVYLVSPLVCADGLTRLVCDALALDTEGLDRQQRVQSLEKHLREGQAEGRRAAVLIEDCHSLASECFEEIRLLAELTHKRNRLLSFVLLGRPPLDAVLMHGAALQVSARVTQSFWLPPLAQGEVGDYLSMRMEGNGAPRRRVFTGSAVKELTVHSGGIIRAINTLAHKSLLSAFAEGKQKVDKRHVVAAQMFGRAGSGEGDGDGNVSMIPMARGAATRELPQGAAMGRVLLAGILFMIGLECGVLFENGFKPISLAASQTRLAALNGWGVAHTLPMRTGSARAILPASTQAMETSVTEMVATDPFIKDRLETSYQWLQTADGKHWTIQLMVVENAESVRNLKASLAGVVSDRLRFFRLHGERFLVMVDDYPTYGVAKAALATLPDSLKAAGPYVVPVDGLRRKLVTVETEAGVASSDLG